MSFQEEKKNSVFLHNFQKRLSQFFQKNKGFPKTSSVDITSSTSNSEDFQTLSSSTSVNTSSFSSNFNPLNNPTESMSLLKSKVLRRPSSNKNLTPNSRNDTKSTLNRGSRFQDNKQQVVSITYEEIGLFPRSFNRVFDRFFKQLFFDVENLVIQEYRFYRYLFLTTVKCVFILLFVPLTINFLAKNYLVRPITEHYWNTHQPEIFLNSYQQKRAFNELQDFEEKIYFESLILTNPTKTLSLSTSSHFPQNTNFIDESSSLPVPVMPMPLSASSFTPVASSTGPEYPNGIHATHASVPTGDRSDTSRSYNIVDNQSTGLHRDGKDTGLQSEFYRPQFEDTLLYSTGIGSVRQASPPEFFSDSVQNRLHEKILELAIHYNEESIEAITNFFADLMSFSSLCYLFFALEIQINITKSFLLEVFFGLDDSKKSLFILFLTDLLVGYHSPNIWELFFSSFFDHYGLPENQTTIFLLVATLPVLLDVLFKYLIFRHLNRASPATVATYHAMIE